jgi:hypothetical protein
MDAFKGTMLMRDAMMEEIDIVFPINEKCHLKKAISGNR